VKEGEHEKRGDAEKRRHVLHKRRLTAKREKNPSGMMGRVGDFWEAFGKQSGLFLGKTWDQKVPDVFIDKMTSDTINGREERGTYRERRGSGSQEQYRLRQKGSSMYRNQALF